MPWCLELSPDPADRRLTTVITFTYICNIYPPRQLWPCLSPGGSKTFLSHGRYERRFELFTGAQKTDRHTLLTSHVYYLFCIVVRNLSIVVLVISYLFCICRFCLQTRICVRPDSFGTVASGALRCVAGVSDVAVNPHCTVHCNRNTLYTRAVRHSCTLHTVHA